MDAPIQRIGITMANKTSTKTLRGGSGNSRRASSKGSAASKKKSSRARPA